MSSKYTPEQQQAIQNYQNNVQTLDRTRQNLMQLEGRKREFDRTMEGMKDLAEDQEVYRSAGQVLYKTDVATTRKDITDQMELLEINITKLTKQVKDMETAIQEQEKRLISSLK